MESAEPVFLGEKKKILILSSKGGYGHMAASLSIQEVFQGRYEFQEMFPIEEINRLGRGFGENLYNNLLQNDWIRMTNFLSSRLAPLIFQARKGAIESLVREKIEKERPDLILSLIPFVNYPASEAARKQGIPYLLVTTDNDLSHWTLGMEKATHLGLKVTIGRDLPLTRGVLAKHNIRKEQIEVIGLPVHPAFLEKKDPLFIREEFSIPAGKPVVLLMMGGAGGKRAIEYAEKLRDIKLPIHVVICTGNNHALYQKMLSLTKEQKEVSFSILSFTNRIADLMQVADLLITKPGPGTINEAMLRQLPILVDNASSTLVWERVNQELVEEMGIGQVLHTIEDLKEPVAKYLLDTAVISRVANAYRSICLPSFFDHIVRVVESLLDPVYRR